MSRPPFIILCNGARPAESPGERDPLVLEYQQSAANRNVRIGLPGLLRGAFHLPDRVLDLVEIASYVYCADRHISRGARDQVEYLSWGRDLRFHIKVRDFDFWHDPNVADRLSRLLCFLSGDASVEFAFQPGHATPPTSLLDHQQVTVADDSDVVLFSGGLDSLTGVLDRLNGTDTPLSLVSHRSGQSGITRTQEGLFRALRQEWPRRIQYLPFECGLTGQKHRANEETQRTRFFLYAAIAYAYARALSRDRVFAYENGITSLNFPKRQDLINARASRTTHPKTIMLLGELLSQVQEGSFTVETPFLWETKTDVLALLSASGGSRLLSSSISCSRTFKASEGKLQCGGCPQCIDRRFAVFAAGLEASDEAGLYDADFVLENVEDPEVRAAVTEYVRQASSYAETSLPDFYASMAPELSMLVSSIPGMSEEELVNRVWQLCTRHGSQVGRALGRMQELAHSLSRTSATSTLLAAIRDREYLGTAPQPADSSVLARTLEFFVAYSHRDERVCDRLRAHLSPLRREGLIRTWYDRRIGPGDEWRGVIDEHLNQADVVVLLVSPDFINSDYCYDVEMERALERHHAGEALVVPVIVQYCLWEHLPLGELLALPRDGVPVTDRRWRNREEALTDVARELREKAIGLTGS